MVAADVTPPCCHEAPAVCEPEKAAVPECAALESWIERYVEAAPDQRDALEAEGVALAEKRQEVMTRLIEANPERALQNAVPMVARKQLPQRVLALVEERVSGRADFETAVTTPLQRKDKPQVSRDAMLKGKRYQAYVYGKRTWLSSEKNVLMHGIAIGNKLAVHESPVRVLEDGEIPDANAPIGNPDKRCPVSGNVASRGVDAGGTIWYVCQHGHIEALTETQLMGGEGGSGQIAAAGPGINKTGANTLLYVRVDFSDKPGEPVTVANAQSSMSVVNSFFQDNSYGMCSINTTVTTQVYRLPQTAAYYANAFGALINDATNAANAHYSTNNYNLLVVASAYLGNGAAGQGYVGQRGCAVYGYFDLRVTAHELGHNFGVWHANYWTGDPTSGTSGGNEEYGDSYDVMGFGDNSGLLHFNAQFKRTFGWLSSGQVRSVSSSGTYRVHAFDQGALGSNFGALTVAKPGDASNRVYWVAMRQKITGNFYLMNGVDLHWAPWGSSAGGTHLLDTTYGSGGGKGDAAILVGRTFSDTTSGVHITPIAKNATTPASLDVVVNIGSFAGNGAPSGTINASNSTPPANTNITLTANASDPNGDAMSYSWNFGDGSISSNNSASQTKAWGVNGTYTVYCDVYDMKGGKTTLSKVITVGGTGNNPPTASFTANPTTGTAPLTVNFNASASSDSDGTIASYSWNFGNGQTGSGVTASQTFATGTYTVTLTVTDNGGASSSTTRTVTAVPSTPELLVHWKLDEGSGATATDSSGKANHGSIANGPAWVSGTSGSALNMDGANDYVITPQLNNPTPAVTLAAWIKPNAAGGVVFSELGQGSVNTGWHDSQIEVQTNGTLKVAVWTGGVTSISVGTVNVGAWNHVALTYDGSTLRGYLNGSLGGSTAAAKQNPGALYYAVGAPDSTSQGNGAAFSGTIDEVRIYSGALTAAEIAALATLSNQPPVANFTANPTSGNAPLAVSFNGTSSTDSDGTIVSYAWNFGDGTTGSGATTSHIYSAGTWTATLTVTDNGGATNSKSTTINVANPPPPPTPLAIASGPTATPNPAKAGQNVTFTATATGGTQPYTWTWNFGDGSSAGSAGTAVHAYSAVGTYTMTLTVRDSAGASVQKSLSVTIKRRSGKSGALNVSKVAGTLNYTSSGKDAIQIVGSLDESVNLAGQEVTVDVNGQAVTFSIDARGTGKSGLSSIKIKGNSFQVTLKNQSLSAALQADTKAVSGSVEVNVDVGVGEDGFEGSASVSLTNRPGKSGKLRK
ncbi:MAG TPA: PKD domain-containing protein [Planctomycetota bacterium]|nr:PKD domain-containing protein [Planctomycetota bacterium]